MPTDGTNQDAKGGSSTEEGKDQNLELEVSSETEDQEELYDKDGKPLPWNQSKRFRKLYGEAKEGRKVVKELEGLGLKPSDVPRLRGALDRLEAYDRAYAQYLEEEKRGRTSPEDDAGADEAQKEIARLKKQLKGLGVKFADDDEEDVKRQREREALSRRDQIVGAAQDRIVELLEDAGVDFSKMDAQDRKDLIEEFDLKITQRLGRDEEGRNAFLRGSLRPIEKHFSAVLEKSNVPRKRDVRSSGINNLPPRIGQSHVGSRTQQQSKSGPARNVRDVTEEVVADLKARNAARRAAEE